MNHQERRNRSPDEGLSPFSDDGEAQLISISPASEPAYEEINVDGKLFLIARNTFSEEELAILEHRAKLHENENLEQSTPLPAAADTDPMESTRSHGMRPRLHYQTSATSGSTPSNSQALLPPLSTSPSGTAGITPSASDLNQVGASHTSATESGNHLNVEGERSDSHSPQPPPSLTYADSGFHEPSSFPEDEYVPYPAFDLEGPEPCADEASHVVEQAQATVDQERVIPEHDEPTIPGPLIETQPAANVVETTTEPTRDEAAMIDPKLEGSATVNSGIHEKIDLSLDHEATVIPMHTTIDAPQTLPEHEKD